MLEFWEKVVSPTLDARRGQVVRPKLDRCYLRCYRPFRKARRRFRTARMLRASTCLDELTGLSASNLLDSRHRGAYFSLELPVVPAFATHFLDLIESELDGTSM